MKKHADKFDESKWPFEFPFNRAVYTTKGIMQKDDTINLIMHDNDGDWQFLPGTSVESEECSVICAGCLYEKYPYIGEYAKLEPGLEVYRDNESSDWILYNTLCTKRLIQNEY